MVGIIYVLKKKVNVIDCNKTKFLKLQMPLNFSTSCTASPVNYGLPNTKINLQ